MDEGSGKSDEEYEDLVLQDENGYCSDDPDPSSSKKLSEKMARDVLGKNVAGDLKYQYNLQNFCKIKVRSTEPSCSHSLLAEKCKNLSSRTKKHFPSDASRSYRRTQSIPAPKKPGL